MWGNISRFAGDVFSAGKDFIGDIGKSIGVPSTPDIPMPYGPGGAADGSGLGQAQQIQSAINPGFEATKDTISHAEGTFNSELGTPDYSVRYGDTQGGTLDTSAPHPEDARPSPWGSPYSSAASGAYQFMPDTWKRINDGQNAPMTPENQDAGFETLLDERGFDTSKPFAEEAYKIAPEWASVPMRNGQSRYNQPVKNIGELDSFHRDRLAFHERERRNDVYQQRAGGLTAPGPATPSPEPSFVRPERNDYSVKAGDTLYSIARDRGVSVEELARANNIDDINLIHIGQELNI